MQLPLHWRLIVLVVLSCQLCTLWGTVQAAPHLISPYEHPYDPDWPEVYLILQHKCMSCHRLENERTDLTSYQSIISAQSDGQPLVLPGNADCSLLFESVVWNTNEQADSPLPDQPLMPPNHLEWLTDQQIATLRRWINRGALEYRLPATCDIRPLTELNFPSARQCAACHPKQFEQWSMSMHAYAQLSPVFEAFNLTLQERTGGTLGTFCTRCHTPTGTALGENGLRRNVHRSRLSLEGVSCVVCHRQARPQHRNSGRIILEPGQALTSCMFGPFEVSVSSQVGSHPSIGTPYIKTSQFCGNCHDVTSPGGVRLEEAYSEWQNSPSAAEGVRCHDCHMGPVQGVAIPEEQRPWGRAASVPGIDPALLPLRPLSDHTFAGPDYSLLPDTEFPHMLDWMYEKDYRDPSRLTPHERTTLTELRRHNRILLDRADRKRYELLSHAARLDVRHPEHGRCGDRVVIDVGVVSTVGGHSFPTGFTAERQAWVAIEVLDASGNLLMVSGNLDCNGDLRDEHSRSVLSGDIARDHRLFNLQNKFYALTSKGTDRSVVLSVNRHLQPLNVLRPATQIAQSFGRSPVFRVAKGSLPPLKSLWQSYSVRLPRYSGDCCVHVRLNFRHLPPTLLDHVGAPHLKRQLEVVRIDAYDSIIEVKE